MSRTHCPHCGAELLATVSLRSRARVLEAYRAEGKQEFNCETAHRMFEDGISIAAIAEQYGLPAFTVRHRLREWIKGK